MQWLIDIVYDRIKVYVDALWADWLASVQGIIVTWSGLTADVPEGWQICDGTNGTPDLRNEFIYGAEIDGDVGDVGGADEHSHTFTGDGHYHTLLSGAIRGGTAKSKPRTDTIPAVGTTDLTDNYPPFIRLFYIMKL